jgi:ribosomal protein S18 acetylase RimI-like enzyme
MKYTEKHSSDSAETAKGIQMVRASESQLTPAVLEEFAELLMEGVFHPVLDVSEETREQLGDVLHDLHSKKRPIPVGHAIRATGDWEEYKENLIDHYRMLAADNDLVLAMDGEKIVGMSGCQGIGYRDNKEVYEIVHSVVLPEHRGKGISSLLADAVMERMYEHSHDAFLLTNTDNNRRIKSWEHYDPQILTPEEHVDIYPDLPDDERQKFLDRWKAKAAEGTRILLVSVKKALGK